MPIRDPNVIELLREFAAMDWYKIDFVCPNCSRVYPALPSVHACTFIAGVRTHTF